MSLTHHCVSKAIQNMATAYKIDLYGYSRRYFMLCMGEGETSWKSM